MISKKVKITSFGTFQVVNKKERVGRNPKTKIEAKISSRKVVKFKPSLMFKEKVNMQSTGGHRSLLNGKIERPHQTIQNMWNEPRSGWLTQSGNMTVHVTSTQHSKADRERERALSIYIYTI